MHMRLFGKRYKGEQEQYLEYGWVFVIVFFLVLFLSQALFISILGPIKSGFLWILLIIWSIFAAYYLLFGNSRLLYSRVHQKIASLIEKRTTEKHADTSKIKKFEKSAPEFHDKEEPRIHFNIFEKKLEQKAHDKGALISGEGIRHIMNFGGGAEKALKDVVERGRNAYPRFDGWTVLNKSQVISLLSHGTHSRVPFSVTTEELNGEEDLSLHEEAVTEELSRSPRITNKIEEEPIKKRENVKAPKNLPTEVSQTNKFGATATFVGLLCDGDEGALFVFIREMRQDSDNGIRIFIKEAILMLDRIYEHRVGGVCYVDQYALEKTRHFSNEELEEIIAILVGSIDNRYRLPEIGVKLSLVRAVEYIKRRKKN